MNKSIFLRRVVLNNYKSIKECSVELGPLSFLVGQNGAGKSNFLDALRLVTEALNTSMEHALRERGGISEVRRRSAGHPTHFGVRLEWSLPSGSEGVFAFKIGARERGGFEVQQEDCRIFNGIGKGSEHFYEVLNGKLKASNIEVAPPIASDRLYLVAAAGLPSFRPIYDALSHMGFYNLNPDEIREPQSADPGEVLKRDGANLAGVLGTLEKDHPSVYSKIVEFLSKVVPGVQAVTVKPVGKKQTLEFRQLVGKSKDPWRFLAENMSDGTLRALGVLTALFQSAKQGVRRVPFVGIEEPETAVHPGAAGMLREGLRIASETTQIAVTSHSPDLLDDKDIPDNHILAVVNRNGETLIGPLDEAGRSAIRDRLYTAGELLRLNQIEPDDKVIGKQSATQLDLFSQYRKCKK
ncbi:MAG: AAA family ATPase [Elusimicrobia bacterium]|nr:AAA family ATPase [Elusimicrobiota bacterium]